VNRFAHEIVGLRRDALIWSGPGVPGSTLTPTAHEVLKPDQRDIDWEGRKMLAIQLPGADENAAWLIAAPTLWDQFHATITRFAPRGAPPQPDAAEATSSDI